MQCLTVRESFPAAQTGHFMHTAACCYSGAIADIGIGRMRLRQVAVVAAERDPVRDQMFRLFGLSEDFEDPGVGAFLHNSVMAIGDEFLEIVAPIEPDTTAERLLERRGGDGGYMVLVQVDDIEHYRSLTEELGIRKVWNTDRDQVKAFHVHPRDIGAAIVSFDWMDPPHAWEWGGPGWEHRRAANVDAILAVDIQGADPEALARQWAAAMDRPVRRDGERFRIELDRGAVNVVDAADGRGDGVCGIEFSASNRPAIEKAADTLGLAWQDDRLEVCGTWLRFV